MKNLNDIESLLAGLPPIIARQEVPKYFGGIISAKTLANLDSMGKGPRHKLRIGGKSAYTREDLISFFVERTHVVVSSHVKKPQGTKQPMVKHG